MAKASMAGRTKTRLVPPLTAEEAATLNTVFLRDAADNLLATAKVADASCWMAYSPAGSAPFFRTNLPAGIGLLETVAPTLGGCLLGAAEALLGAGHDAVCLVNSDSPTLPVGYLAEAVAALAAAGERIVLGPATDGGYYLIGMKRAHAGLFEDIAWSTEKVFAETVARAAALGLAVHRLPSWYDVDDGEALHILLGEVLDGRPFRGDTAPAPANWTRRYLSQLVGTSGLGQRIGALGEAS
jgi:rSAM/selenodomain-associated transferase 1